MKKLIYTAAVLSSIVCGSVFAQADSSDVPPLRGTPRVLPLAMQERETPVTNNITNTTQQITQVVQPNTYQVSGNGSGPTTAAAWANCGGGTLLGGGGSCNDGQGLVAVGSSQPSGNSWVIGCQSLNYNYVWATAYAVCSAN